MAKVKVVIPDDRYIPTLGKGPFRKPIAISEETYRMLTRMNYVLRVVKGKQDETVMEKVTIERGKVNTDDVETLQVPKPDDLEEDQEVVIESVNVTPEAIVINSDDIVLNGQVLEEEPEDEDGVEEETHEVEEEVEEEEVDPKDRFTQEELDFLKDDALKKEITDKFDDKGIKYNSTATIKELLDIVGLKR